MKYKAKKKNKMVEEEQRFQKIKMKKRSREKDTGAKYVT